MNQITVQLCFIFLSTGLRLAISEFDEMASNKSERLLNLLSMVRFNNGLCKGADERYGVCIPVTDCNRNRGTANGQCAQGFGVCCLLEASCGEMLRTNNSYFVNPGYPDAVTRSMSCSITVQRLGTEICQLRLDMDNFALASTSNGVCSADAFIITGQETNQEIPTICGSNKDQHVYVHLTPGNLNPVVLMATTSAGGLKRWRIRVTQIECGNPTEAPSGCLQYFMGGSGSFKSFNYDTPQPDEAGGEANYMSDTSYAICIRRESGFCGVQFRPMNNNPEAFDLDPGLGSDELSNTDSVCVGDSLIIPGACNAGENGLPWPNQASASKFCGYRLNAVPQLPTNSPNGLISTLPGAVQIFFNSDNQPPSPQRYDRGFHLEFQQRPCTFVQSFRRRDQLPDHQIQYKPSFNPGIASISSHYPNNPAPFHSSPPSVYQGSQSFQSSPLIFHSSHTSLNPATMSFKSSRPHRFNHTHHSRGNSRFSKLMPPFTNKSSHFQN